MSKQIGLTTTVPSEVIWAAGFVPVDLNNIFISHPHSGELVEQAEIYGFPRTTCSWIKGIYAVARQTGIKRVIAVTEGDCSNTQALMEVLQSEGVEVIPFAFPYGRDVDLLRLQIQKLAGRLGIDLDRVQVIKRRLDGIRRLAHRIDEMTWREGRVSGRENHLFLVSCSDMESNLEQFEQKLQNFLAEAGQRPQVQPKVRLGYIGVPPISPDIYDFLEGLGARVVYNEIQRQFAMPYETADIVEQYLRYTYPYDIFARIEDIIPHLRQRQIQGVIHYVQSFCFRHIEDIIIRRQIDIPILTLEGDRPGPLDAQTRLRLEGFVESLKIRSKCAR